MATSCVSPCFSERAADAIEGHSVASRLMSRRAFRFFALLSGPAGAEQGAPSLVPVLVVHVRHMRVRVAYRAVLMKMRVGFARRIKRAVDVAMMLVMDVGMGVRHRFVKVLVLVVFRQVQPDA